MCLCNGMFTALYQQLDNIVKMQTFVDSKCSEKEYPDCILYIEVYMYVLYML